MDVNVEKTGSYSRKLSVTLPAQRVDEAFDSALKTLAKQARIPGFRAGKAPRRIVEMRYGPQLQNDVEQDLVSKSLIQALAQTEESPVAMPEVDSGALKRGTEFSYVAEFEVPPEVKLEKYLGIAIERLTVEVPETDVDRELESMREEASELVPVKIREEVQEGDVVTMNYEGFIDDQPFPGGTGENAMLEIGGNEYLPGFSEGVEGQKVGATVSFPIIFPEEYHAQELAGKTATFKVTIKEIKTKELPTLNDDFAIDVGEESLVALKSKIRERLDAQKQREVDDEQRTLVLKALVEKNPIEIPPSMIRQQSQRMVRNAVERMSHFMGPQFQMSEEQIGSLLKDNEKEAEFQVHSGLLLLEIGKDAKLEVTDEELTAEIDKMVDSAGEEGARVRSHYNDDEQRDRLRFKLAEDKTIAHVLEASTPAAPSTTSEEIPPKSA